MIRFIKYSFCFLIIISIYNLFKIDTIKSINIQKKINKSYLNNFTVSISNIPIFDKKNTNTIKEFENIIYFLSKKDKKIKNIFKKSKISLKIRQLGENKIEQWNNFEYLIKLSNKNNIFVWVACVFKNDLDLEYEFYEKIKKKYDNVGLTLSTSHNSVSKKVDLIIKSKGHIRLVKGIYNGDISDINYKTNLYYENAKKILDSNYYHCFATHDFKLLKKIKKYNLESFIKNVEISFFYDSFKYINKNINTIKNNKKSFYIYYGNKVEYLYQHLFLYFFENNYSNQLPFLLNKIIYHIF